MSVELADLYRDRGDGTAVLAASRCPVCGLVVFPRQPWCPRCTGTGTEDVELGPAGTLVAFTGVRHPAPGSKVAPPYAVGLAEFERGVRVAGLLTVPSVEGLSVGQEITITAARAFEEQGRVHETFRFRT